MSGIATALTNSLLTARVQPARRMRHDQAYGLDRVVLRRRAGSEDTGNREQRNRSHRTVLFQVCSSSVRVNGKFALARFFRQYVHTIPLVKATMRRSMH